jgi:hypothetical protein
MELKNLISILRVAAVPMIEGHSTHTLRHYPLEGAADGDEFHNIHEITRMVTQTGKIPDITGSVPQTGCGPK